MMNVNDKDAREVLEEAMARFHPGVALACSFQAEDVVVLDMMLSIEPEARVFAIDTGRLHEETYELAEKIRRKYGVAIEWVFPDRERVEGLIRNHGLYSFRQSIASRKECCGIRKVEPLGRALEGLDAWVTGMRREQSASRQDSVRQIERDVGHGGIAKINPLASWSTDDVWQYVLEHNLPFNALYHQGFRQIGCVPCTTTVRPGEDDRAGRWRWEVESSKECGLHVDGSGI